MLTIRYQNKTDGEAAAKNFLTKLFNQIRKSLAPEDEEYELINKIESAIDKDLGMYISGRYESSSRPAASLWDQVMANSSGDGSEEIASALDTLEPFISWIDDPGYRSHDIGERFSDIYACFEILGNNGLFIHDSVTIGVMVLGAEFYYPSHSHPDYECIYAFSGRGTWHMKNGPIISIPAGTRIFIPPDSAHTFWTMSDPFGAIYICLKKE